MLSFCEEDEEYGGSRIRVLRAWIRRSEARARLLGGRGDVGTGFGAVIRRGTTAGVV